jgi:hypothetical protein
VIESQPSYIDEREDRGLAEGRQVVVVGAVPLHSSKNLLDRPCLGPRLRERHEEPHDRLALAVLVPGADDVDDAHVTGVGIPGANLARPPQLAAAL